MAKKKIEPQLLFIKNMVCDRCVRVVREEFERLGLDVRSVRLGEAEIGGSISGTDRERIRSVLTHNGFELIEDRNAKLIEAVKAAIIRLVHHDHDAKPMTMKTSEYIAKTVGKDYHALSVLFSAVENITIEQYLIRQRIERVKELIKYNDRSLSEIAYHMNYSSVQHLSNQFKAVTGMTPSQFKALSPKHTHHHHRRPIDKVT